MSTPHETHTERPETTQPASGPGAPRPRPPRGPSIAWIIVVLILVGAALWAGTVWGGRVTAALSDLWRGDEPHDQAERIRGAPGSRSAEDGHDHGGGAAQPASAEYYSCGMHPWVILPSPGDCPICQMELTPIDPAKFTGEVSINPVVAQNIGVRIEPVVTGPLVRTVRTVGTVDYDETRVRDVNIKVSGWIEKLYVDYLGAEVEAGRPLFDLYSPELYSAQEEYLLAWRNRDRIGAAFLPDASRNAELMLDAARTKLAFYDITDEQIEALRAGGQPAKTMTIRSPHTGIVIAKHANEGMKVGPGMRVYRIADLSRVWVMVTLYEQQLPFVSVGQKAVMTLPYIPGQTFEGKVIYTYPYLDPQSRQLQARLEFDNPNLLLKPGMYANVELKGTLASRSTLAPRSAIIDTGERQVAFVSLGEGRFDPREVRLGPETDHGMVQVLDGLSPGEMVVTSGQFLLDSETKMREGLAKMVRGTMATDQPPTAQVQGASHLRSLPDAARRQLGRLLDAYFAIGESLAGDTIAGIADQARAAASAVDALLKIEIPTAPRFWPNHPEAATVRGKALDLIDADDLETGRLLYADLSTALAKLTRATGVPPDYGRAVEELRCPMYPEGQGGGIWLQPSGDVRNPFFGQKMLKCFDQRIALPVTGREAQPPARPLPGDGGAAGSHVHGS